MKKAYLNIIVLLIVLIPSLLAVIAYFTTNATPVQLNSIDKITVIAPDSTEYTVDKATDSDGFIGLAMEMNENATKQIALPSQLVDSEFYTFTYHALGGVSEYKYYFSDDIESAYYVNNNGIAYKISSENAEKFLNTKYAHCLYDYNTPPVATLNSEVMSPSNINWQFKSYKGEYASAVAKSGINNTIETYGTPSISFDIEPDNLSVTLKDGDSIIFDGHYEELTNSNISNVLADATIVATWYDDSSRAYRGEITYDLQINFKEPPVFYISSNTAVTGNILTVSVLSAEDASQINLSISPDIGIKPKFVDGEKYTNALLPISRDVIPGSYVITADYNGQSKTVFAVDVASDYKDAYDYNIDATLFDSLYNEANVSEYKTFLNSLFNSLTHEPLFEGKFISGLPANTFESADYGTLLTIPNNGVSFENPGKYYTCTKTTDIHPVNSGKVIFAGEKALTGNVVAVDHGMGLVSLYMHLGSVNVNVGDDVTKETVIGTSGRTGLMSKKGASSSVVRVELYVNKTPVDIDPLVNNGIIFTD